MKYDFSKIKTEELREAKKSRKDVCGGIICSHCPFSGPVCDAGNNGMIYNEFCKELNRRDKMGNKMPELKAGMIVDIEGYSGITRCILLGTDRGLQPIAENWNWQCNMRECEILRIYKSEATNYEDVFNSDDFVKLIWSKKSDKDIKIEELEATIKKAQEQIQELKG